MRAATSAPERPLRVLYVFGSLDPKTGGPANSAPNIWVSAARAGISAAAVCTAEDPLRNGEARTLDRLAAAGVEAHPFKVSRVRQLRRWGVSVPLALWVLRHARRYDLVHAHGAWMVSSLVGLVAARLSGTPFVLTPHEHLADSDVAKSESRVRHLIKATMRRLYLRWIDLIIVASATEGRASVGAGARAPCAVIYHPVVEDASALPPARTVAGARAELRVGYLGRFDPKKQLELLIAAVAATPGTSLSIAGGGDDAYEAQLKELAARSGIGGRLQWLGFLPATALPPFFAGIDVLVMPSRFEGFGMVAAEAMCHGLPVVVSRATGIAELVERYDCGVVVAAETAAISAALAALEADPERRARFSARAIEVCRGELSFDGYGARLAERYRALISRPRACRDRAAPR